MQAIYGWRSASVANIDAFAQHFGRDGAAPVRVLSVNRRSGTPILEAANRIADDLRAQHPQVARLRPPEPLGAVVRAALLPTVADEREWIADQVRAMVESGTPPEDIAILGRANDQLGPLQRLLVARGIPASISGDRRPDHQPVRDRRAVHASGPGRPGGQHLGGGAPGRAAMADRAA